MELILICLILLLALGFWLLYANETTYFQRGGMISGIKYQFDCDHDFPAFTKRMSVFKSISYDRHMFYVATFRDPMKLYDF